jgi:hypothetical protein
MGREIEINVEKQGCVAISYAREVGRVASITHYFGKSPASASENVLPLGIYWPNNWSSAMVGI